MRVALRAFTSLPLCLRLMIIGIEPMMSITANRTKKAEVISIRFNSLNIYCMVLKVRLQIYNNFFQNKLSGDMF